MKSKTLEDTVRPSGNRDEAGERCEAIHALADDIEVLWPKTYVEEAELCSGVASILDMYIGRLQKPDDFWKKHAKAIEWLTNPGKK